MFSFIIEFQRHIVRNLTIIGAAFCFLLTIVVNFMMGDPLSTINTLILIVSLTALGAVVGASMGFIFRKVNLTLGIDGKTPIAEESIDYSQIKSKEMATEYVLGTDDALAFYSYYYYDAACARPHW